MYSFWYWYGKYIFIADAGDYDLMLNYQIIENSLFLY